MAEAMSGRAVRCFQSRSNRGSATAGATLVQGYTGFIYGGPLLPDRIHSRLARRVREAGFTSIQQALDTSQTPAPGRGYNDLTVMS